MLGIWEEFQSIQRTNPTSLVFLSPFGSKARPLCGTHVTEDQRKELDAQERLWSYLDNLGKVLRAFNWPASVVDGFRLLSSHQKYQMVGPDWMNGFEEHHDRLAAMVGQGVFSGCDRKLSVVEARREPVFDLPPDI